MIDEKDNADWPSLSFTWILSLLLGLSLLIFGLMGLIAPQWASGLYGVPFASGVAVLYNAKAVRDCMLAALLLNAVRTHSPRAAQTLNLIGIPISLCDLLVVRSVNPDAWPQIVLLHGGTVVTLIIVVTAFALRSRRTEPRERVAREPKLRELPTT